MSLHSKINLRTYIRSFQKRILTDNLIVASYKITRSIISFYFKCYRKSGDNKQFNNMIKTNNNWDKKSTSGLDIKRNLIQSNNLNVLQ